MTGGRCSELPTTFSFPPQTRYMWGAQNVLRSAGGTGSGRRKSATETQRSFSYMVARVQIIGTLRGSKTSCHSMESSSITMISWIRPILKSPTTPAYGRFQDIQTKWKQFVEVSVWINSIYWDTPGAASSPLNMP